MRPYPNKRTLCTRIFFCIPLVMTLKVGAVVRITDCDRLPRVHRAQSKDGVCVGAGNLHNLHSISVSSKLEILLGHLPGSWGNSHDSQT